MSVGILNRFEERGVSYVMVLFTIAVLGTMSLSFILMTGLQRDVASNYADRAQAHYLARAGVNVGTWRMLSEPGFPDSEEVYYMHSLGGGEFGYKVERPTATTFATVETVGTFHESEVRRSYTQLFPSNITAAYGQFEDAIPDCRAMFGANWSNPAETVTTGAPEVYWLELAGCPVRKEIVMGTMDEENDINLAVWDGTSWGNSHVFSTPVPQYKCFDIAYESQSGDALVVGRYDGTTLVRYNVWNGAEWLHATPQPAYNIAGGEVSLVTMASCPGNDDILIATVDTNNNIRIVHWDGGSFNDQGEIVWDSSTVQYGVAQIVYETLSGDALILWGRNQVNNIRYMIWDGANLSPLENLPDFGNEVNIVRAAADPTSDYIIVAGVDTQDDINVAVWDGDAWIDSREVETSAANSFAQCLDVAWEAAGEDAVIAWAPSGPTNVRTFTWRKGTGLDDSIVQDGPDFLAQPWVVRLLPVSDSERLVLLGQTEPGELRYSLWSGAGMKGDPAILLESSMSTWAWANVTFDVAEVEVPRTGGTGTGSGGNQRPNVLAGPDDTITLPTDTVDLDGTVTDDGLPDPPAAFTTLWSVTSGPGTVTFGDDTQVDTTAQFSTGGVYVLRLTADDSNLTGSDEVTITVMGNRVIYEEFTEAKRPSNVQDITLSIPPGTSEGDLLIAVVVTDDNETLSAPAGEGWSEIDQDVGYWSVTMGVWWKLADASESPTHQFTWGSIEEAYGWMMRFTGHDQADPINAAQVLGGDANPSPPSPAVTTTVANTMILRIGGFDDDDINVDDTGLTDHTDITMDKSSNGNGTCSGGAAYKQQDAIGDSGASSFLLTGWEQYRTITIAIAPNAGG